MQSLKIQDLFKRNSDTGELRGKILRDLIIQQGEIQLLNGPKVKIEKCFNIDVLIVLENLEKSDFDDVLNAFKDGVKYREFLIVGNGSIVESIKLSDIAKTSIFKGKKTLNSKGAQMTDEQEIRSQRYIQSLINTGEIDMEKESDCGDLEWKESSKLHAELVRLFLGKSDKKYKVFRNDAFTRKFFIFLEDMPNLKISTWNPADIWMIEEDFEDVFLKMIENGVKKSKWKIKDLNLFLKEMFELRKFIPISLKKVSSRFAKFETMNLSSFNLYDWDIEEIKFIMEWKNNIELTTKDTTFYATGLKDGEEVDLLCQLKQYPWMSGNIQVEGRSKIALARYGKISTSIVDNFLSEQQNDLNYLFKYSDKDLTPLGRFLGVDFAFEFDLEKFVNWFSFCQETFKDTFITNFKDKEEFRNFLQEVVNRLKPLNTYEKRILKNYIRCKLQGLKYFYDFAYLKRQGRLSETLQMLFKGALKINENSGVYLKLG